MTAAPSDDIRQEPAIKKLLEWMPSEVQQSFTEAQLSCLRVAIGDQYCAWIAAAVSAEIRTRH